MEVEGGWSMEVEDDGDPRGHRVEEQPQTLWGCRDPAGTPAPRRALIIKQAHGARMSALI